jgi:toxin ParE1/3/4
VRLEWTAGAKRDLREIVTYIWLENPQAAKRMDARFRASGLLLKTSPYAGRPGVVPGTREFIPHPSYRMVYQLKGETVSVVALVHTSRQWPPVPDEGNG